MLSIYHPARGFNLFATSTTSSERHELLISTRAALKMQFDDKSIWANWDLVVRSLDRFGQDVADNIDDYMGRVNSPAGHSRRGWRSGWYINPILACLTVY